MLNELYTFAEPVQVVPFSNLKWGKFTLLHTHPASLHQQMFSPIMLKMLTISTMNQSGRKESMGMASGNT